MTDPETAPAAHGNVVEFKNVTKRFGNLTVIRDVTFSVPDVPHKGEFIAILGPSGLRQVDRASPHRRAAAAPSATEGTVLVGGNHVECPGRRSQHGLPGLHLVRQSHRRGQCGVRAGMPRRACSGTSRTRARVDRQGGARRQARRDQVSERAVWRHAAARRNRPDADSVAAHHSHGRTVRCARSDDPAAHAGAAGRSLARGRRRRSSS